MIFRYLPLCFAALFFVLVFPHVALGQIDFNFPKEKVPVLRVDEYYSEANEERRPMLLVYSDGRVVRPVSVNKNDDYKFTLSEPKFKKVLNEIFIVNDFATISDETILGEISKPNRIKRPSSNTFRITTNNSKGSHVVDFGTTWVHDRLGLGRKRHMDAEQLQRFLKVEEACRELSHLALIGGEEAFQDVAIKANAKFAEAYPDGPEISDADLYSVRLNKEGKVLIRFMVASKVVERQPVSVWVTKTKGEDKDELSIEVKVFEPIKIHG